MEPYHQELTDHICTDEGFENKPMAKCSSKIPSCILSIQYQNVASHGGFQCTKICSLTPEIFHWGTHSSKSTSARCSEEDDDRLNSEKPNMCTKSVSSAPLPWHVCRSLAWPCHFRAQQLARKNLPVFRMCGKCPWIRTIHLLVRVCWDHIICFLRGLKWRSDDLQEVGSSAHQWFRTAILTRDAGIMPVAPLPTKSRVREARVRKREQDIDRLRKNSEYNVCLTLHRLGRVSDMPGHRYPINFLEKWLNLKSASCRMCDKAFKIQLPVGKSGTWRPTSCGGAPGMTCRLERFSQIQWSSRWASTFSSTLAKVFFLVGGKMNVIQVRDRIAQPWIRV